MSWESTVWAPRVKITLMLLEASGKRRLRSGQVILMTARPVPLEFEDEPPPQPIKFRHSAGTANIKLTLYLTCEESMLKAVNQFFLRRRSKDDN